VTAPSTTRFDGTWLNTPDMQAWLAVLASHQQAKARRREKIERRYR
jgi:hypothetical protein